MKNFKISSKIFVAIIITLSFIIPAAAADTLIPLGTAVGIKMTASGAVIIGFSDTEAQSPAAAAGLKPGDVIKTADGVEILSNSDLSEVVQKSEGKPITIEYVRNGKNNTVSITPVKDDEGKLILGVWVRDSIAGIGTLTYLNPDDNSFGALGHGVSDSKTNVLVPLREGSLVPARIESVKRGRHGEPGELIGNFDTSKSFASLTKNTEGGIFGTIENRTPIVQTKPYPLADRNDIHRGAATILCNVDGDEVREYDIEICAIYFDGEKTKNMLIRATDPELIAKTGGIVCGMSGSPIIQDGKLVGAVTHVLVHDPTKGYGIFIENMLEAAG